jgi:transcriptional regulator with XRE-family HTH domain
MTRELGEELRRARVAAGLSQQTIARSIGTSHMTVGRIERGVAPNVSLRRLARALAVVGLELTARAYPAGSPLRDAAHAALLEKLRALLHFSLRWRTEVPFPNPGDMRAWDALIALPGARIGVEAETRPRDGQELERRLALKHRDGGVDHLILLLADTRSNRAFVRDRQAELAALLPGKQQDALARLAAGAGIEHDTLIPL